MNKFSRSKVDYLVKQHARKFMVSRLKQSNFYFNFSILYFERRMHVSEKCVFYFFYYYLPLRCYFSIKIKFLRN